MSFASVMAIEAARKEMSVVAIVVIGGMIVSAVAAILIRNLVIQ